MRGRFPRGDRVARLAATYATVVGVLLAVALVACWIPARRASVIDPAVALRR